MKKCYGVSMIELLVTLAVISIGLGAAVSFQDVVIRNSLVSQSNDLLSSLQLARSEAFKRMLPIALCASSDGATCVANSVPGALGNRIWETGWIACGDANDNGVCDPGEAIVKSNGALSAKYSLRSNANIGGSLTYLLNGRSKSGGGLFVLCKNANSTDLTQSKAIYVANSGRIALGQDSNGNGVPEDEAGVDITTCKP